MKLKSDLVKSYFIKLFSLLHIVDRDYYLARYPDVAATGIDPVEHYLLFGFREGRSANRAAGRIRALTRKILHVCIARLIGFDPAFYLAQYPDVALAGVNPLGHYLGYGILEGRFRNANIARRKKATILLTVLMASTRKGARAALLRCRREFAFELAKSGAGVRVRSVIWFERILSRYAKRSIFTQCLPVADVSKEQFDWISITHVEPASQYSFVEPEIIDEPNPRPHRTVQVPAKWVASVDNALIIGGFQVVAQDHFILYEPAGDPHSDFVAGSWPYVQGITGTPAVALWYQYERRVELDEAILLSGRCSPNYYHWLIEYLGRLYTVSQLEALRNVPLIVDADMYPQEFESLAAICPDWPIYRLERGTLLKVARLHIPSISTFLPDSVRIPFWQGSALCHSTLAFLRDAVFKRYEIRLVKPTRKIFLVRRGARTILDIEQIESALTNIGFECIDTGKLTFEEQVRLFAEAAMIVGPMGAAFTNAIFCHPECKVLALTSPYGKRFCLQGNLASFAGSQYKIFAGGHPSYEPGDEYAMEDVAFVHSSFSVSSQRLVAEILDWGHEAKQDGIATAS
ncbi:glycosyltransferase family 61 protein [Trinickia fusca]|uniref:EGF domain-specific O-linked N-acetylglucosamine transferase n=1 Tax=Trinickia fusca TaxID=2419777 RepID=A0A494XQ03_9BURK|nr:glycosyltransferase family 61 protein [Trinickia fusca]RKP50856.1 glycosyltransferase family 61 protein [Trinickia fusca]